MPQVNEIFDAAFLEGLSTLRIIAHRVSARGRPAEQRSRDLGSGIEFHDYRPYSPGDDMRSIDWNIYQRIGRVVLRLFIELEDLPLYLMPDISVSAYHDGRAVAGLRTALGLASISLSQMDRVGIIPFSDDLGTIIRPAAGKHQLMHIADRLAALQPSGKTDFARAFSRFATMNFRRGLVCIISDFFDPAGIDQITAALEKVRHRLLFVQLTKKNDADPMLRGDLRLVDCETGVEEDLTVTDGVLEKYKAAYGEFQTKLERFAASIGAGHLRLDCDESVLDQLAHLFRAGRYSA